MQKSRIWYIDIIGDTIQLIRQSDLWYQVIVENPEATAFCANEFLLMQFQVSSYLYARAGMPWRCAVCKNWMITAN